MNLKDAEITQLILSRLPPDYKVKRHEPDLLSSHNIKIILELEKKLSDEVSITVRIFSKNFYDYRLTFLCGWLHPTNTSIKSPAPADDLLGLSLSSPMLSDLKASLAGLSIIETISI